MTTRFQFRHVNELAGLFVLLILVAAAVALFAAARSQHWFAATTEYKLQLPSSGASGLKPGNDIIVTRAAGGHGQGRHRAEGWPFGCPHRPPQ